MSASAKLLGRPLYRSAFTCGIARHVYFFFWTIATQVIYTRFKYKNDKIIASLDV